MPEELSLFGVIESDPVSSEDEGKEVYDFLLRLRDKAKPGEDVGLKSVRITGNPKLEGGILYAHHQVEVSGKEDRAGLVHATEIRDIDTGTVIRPESESFSRKELFSRKWLVILGVVLVLGIIGLVIANQPNDDGPTAPKAKPASPTLTLSSGTVSAGAQLTVSGRFFRGGERVDLRLFGSTVGGATADASGDFTTAITVPPPGSAPVNTSIEAVGAQSGMRATAPLRVVQSSPAPSPGTK